MTQHAPIKLSPQEKALVDALIAQPDLSVKKAAESAGLHIKTALDVYKRENVRRAVGLALLTEKKERLGEIRRQIIDILWQTANFDLRDFFDEKGGFRAVKDMPPANRAAVKGIKQGRYGLELVLVDRTALQLELLKVVDKAIGHAGEVDDATVLDVPAEDPE